MCQERFDLSQGAVGDKNRKCSTDQIVSLNISFDLAAAADGSVSFVGLCGLRYSKDADPELGHRSYDVCFTLLIFYQQSSWVTEFVISHHINWNVFYSTCETVEMNQACLLEKPDFGEVWLILGVFVHDVVPVGVEEWIMCRWVPPIPTY